MRPDELVALLKKEPFEPFRIHLTNGQSHDIRHPEIMAVGRSIAWVHTPAKNVATAVAERRVFVSLIHIVWGEPLEPAKKTASGNGAPPRPWC